MFRKIGFVIVVMLLVVSSASRLKAVEMLNIDNLIIIEYGYTPKAGDLFDQGIAYAMGTLNIGPQYKVGDYLGRIDLVLEGAEAEAAFDGVSMQWLVDQCRKKGAEKSQLQEGRYIVMVGAGPNAVYFEARCRVAGSQIITFNVDDPSPDLTEEVVRALAKMPVNPLVTKFNKRLQQLGVR